MREKMTAERAVAIVREIAAVEGPHAQEVAALSVCVAAIETLPEFSRGRVTKHLRDMFDGCDSIGLLVALVEELSEMKKGKAVAGPSLSSKGAAG